MATAGSVIIDLLMRTGSFETDSKRAEKRVREMQRAISGSFKSMAAGIVGFAGAFVSVRAAFDGFANAVNQADKLNDFNQRLGISAEALSGWGYAARQTGTDIDTLGKGLLRLSRNMSEALNPKSSQAGLFAALGVEIKDAQGKLRSLESVLPEIADGFKALNNETLEAALSQELFGRSGAELLEFLNQGASGIDAMRERARELGIELSQDTLTAADAFNDKLADLQAATQGLWTKVAAELLPALSDLVDKMIEFARDGDTAREVAEEVANAFDIMTTAADLVWKTLQTLGATMRGVTSDAIALFHALMAASKVRSLDFAGAADSWKSAQIAFEMGQEQSQRIPDIWSGGGNSKKQKGPWDNVRGRSTDTLQGDALVAVQARMARQAEIERRLQEFLANPGGGGGGSRGSRGAGAGKSEAEKEAEALDRAFQSANERLKEQLALFGSTTEASRVYYEVTQGGLANLAPAQKQQLLDMASELDLMQQRKDEFDKEVDARREADEAAKRQQETVQDLLSDIAFESELLGKSAEEQEILNNLRWAGVDANSAYGQSIIAATESLQKQREIVNDQIDAMDGMRDSAKGFLDDLKAGEDIWDALKNAAGRFVDVLWEIAANNLIEMAFGKPGTTGQGSAGGNLFSGLLSAFFGGIGGGGASGTSGAANTSFLSAFGGAYAGGGSTMADHAYLVGEDGPELFVPRTAGTVIPAETTTRVMSGGGDTYAPTYQFLMPKRVDNRTQMHVAQAADRVNREASMRNGGRRR